MEQAEKNEKTLSSDLVENQVDTFIQKKIAKLTEDLNFIQRDNSQMKTLLKKKDQILKLLNPKSET